MKDYVEDNDVLSKIYDDKLVSSLYYGTNFDQKITRELILNRFKEFGFVNRLLDKVEEHCNGENYTLGSLEHKDNLLSLLNYVRFNYKFHDAEERSTIINRINECIIKINKATISKTAIVYMEVSNKIKKPFLIDLERETIFRSFEFDIISAYLMDEKVFVEELVPVFITNLELYIGSLYCLIQDNEDLLMDETFLRRTLIVAQIAKEWLKTTPNASLIVDKKSIKEIKKIYKFFK